MQLFPHLQDFLHSDSFPQTHTWSFFLECETTSIMLSKQSVVSTKSLDSERKHLSLIISHFFVGRLILWCEFTGTLLLPRDQQNQPPINCWMEQIQIHGTAEAAATYIISFLFVKLFILISVMSLWWISPVHLHTRRYFIGQLQCYSL